MTTHDMEEAEALCDRIAIMERGVIVTSGAPSELEAPLGADATLEDVFIHAAGPESGGSFRDAARTCRVAHRLG